MSKPDNPELVVYYWRDRRRAEISIFDDVRSGAGRQIYTVKGEEDVLERNFAELLAVVRLAKSVDMGNMIAAILDVKTVVALVPDLEKVLCRKDDT